jgi:hypothetical protein
VDLEVRILMIDSHKIKTQAIHRNRVQAFDQRTQEMYKWPSGPMIQEVIGKGYYLVPLGFVPRKGINPAFEREWRIEFPEAERYLETCLSDTQLRCYIFSLLLFQVRNILF